MRISGLASGMDTESMIKDLMKSRRVPLNKLLQKKQTEEWKRDSFREMNTLLLDLRNKAFDMKLQGTYSKYKVTSSNEAVVSARSTGSTASSSAQFTVDKLAEASRATSDKLSNSAANKKIDPNAILADEITAGNFANSSLGTKAADGTYSFSLTVFQPDGTMGKPTSFSFDPTKESLNDVLKKVNGSGLGVTMFYDAASDQISMSTNHTGNNTAGSGNEIEVAGDFLTQALALKNANTGVNAQFTINGLKTERTSNIFTINGMEYTLKSTGNATISSTQDVDSIFDTIKGFVDKYNEIIAKMNTEVKEKRYRDFGPLLDEEKEGMSEKQIEMWEAKAKSGLLRSDPILTAALSGMRAAFSSVVSGVSDSKFDTLSEIGINTLEYSENGKLHIDEKKLREAITQNGSKVVELFTKTDPDGKFSGSGIAQRLYDQLKVSMDKITEKAGSSASLVDKSFIGKSIDQIDKDIDKWEERLKDIESRYYKQFTAMEQAISKANSQSGWLMQQFGGGQ
ncbi:flagellar hook-associated protein 2 [Brevibacillus choshinensis]|uniref:Flagellar hook-associated protein 2 n=1 Tax=Brevibacillus choshinensis TaxID=54911 RepID=A0ABX7FM24_BRECH|nr:flagellar hook-associated protein 2 [Brevibacillus choshinensis]QRG67308.1 flagellar hook-associated protein 2 [Brevibacillus choshinensis]